MNQFIISLIIVLSGLCSSCSIDISDEKLFDDLGTLTVKIKDSTYKEIKEYNILPYSPKYNQLKDWLVQNNSGWHNSPASYDSRVSVSAKSFRLLVVGNGAIISFIDSKGRSRQIRKKINTKELDFLTE